MSPEASRISDSGVGRRAFRRPFRALLEGEVGLELLRQHPHADVVGQTDDLDRLDAVVGRSALDALDKLLTDPATAVGLFNGEGRFGLDVAAERRLLAPDRGIGAKFRRPGHLAVDVGSVKKIPSPGAMFGVMHKGIVRHAPAKTLMPAPWVKTQQMVAKGFHVRRPKPPDFYIG